MGLRTTSRTPSLSAKESITDCEIPSTSLSVTELLKSTIFLHPDAAISGKMAPALTEPLSPTNKLSSSAASASPRPTAAGSPLQSNNNNNNNIIHTHNNNSDSIGSVDENSSIQTNLISNISGVDKDKIVEGKPASVAAPPTSTPASAKGAFQLAFEQSVGVRKTPTPTVVNGDALSANSSQMGPMCDSKSSQPPPLAANSSPLIKSKFIPIDPEAAAKIITTGFEDFPSDIEEAITAEICLRQNLKFSEEQAQEADQEEKEQSDLKVGVDLLGEQQQGVQSDLKLGEDLLEEPKKSMDETVAKPSDETSVKPVDETPGQEVAAQTKEPNSEKLPKDNNVSICKPNKVNIISVQELPPIKTDSTVTASEEDDNIEERLKQLDSTDDCPMPISQESGGIPTRPSNTLSAQVMSQLTPTNNTNIPTTSSTLCGNPKEFKDNNSEMDHEINDEDLLQVLKGFDTNAGSDICDLAGFLSEYGMNYEDVNPPTAKENPIKEIQIEIEKNQQTMQRKVDFLSRRLRKLQARYMSKQASEEISGLFEWSARTTKRKNSNADHQQLTYAEEKYNPVTTTTMRSVLKKIENVATSVQKLSPVKKTLPANNSKIIEPSPAPVNAVVVPTFDEKITEEIAHVSGRLQAEMREVQSAIDSDATASSSGGESADEMVPYNNITQETLPISKRAAWRYSRDRAGIASRWSWLLSQIADLEYKIRQHTELHQQLRQRKGKVVMLDASEAGNLTAAIGGVNGYRGALPGETTSKTSGGGFTTADETDIEAAIDASHESSQGACRTRAFQSSFYRKRKLFQTANVHTISKKAARPSTIKCGCQWPLHPCALCTGRSDPTAPRDLPDTMMKSQRVALLDPGFHPVLSFSEDISSSIFFETISRDPDWQNRVAKSTAKTVIRGALAAQRAAEKEEQRGAHATSGRITPTTTHNANASSSGGGTTGKRKYIKRNHQDSHSGGSQSTTPLVANKVVKSSKKHHRQRNSSPDYVYPRKLTNTNSSNNNNHQTLSSHQSLHRNAEQSNHHPAHSSLIYQHSKNSKIRKLSSAPTAATTTPTINNNHSGSHLFNNNILNSNYQQINNQQHHSYNNELNFLHCDSLDGDLSTNGLMIGPAGRSRTSSPTHAAGHYKYERSLERRSRTSYDIDNIVIPYSVAAATRVELLPYKEIPTPKWRTIDYDAVNTSKNEYDLEGEKKSERTEENKQLESINSSKAEKQTSKASDINKEKTNISSPCDSDEDEEDISDEAMILRHERALTEERRKFQTFLKFPYSTRSRANRRIDSRAESSGANTPDPTSPAPNTPSVGGDQESIPSPFAPSTPMTPLESIAETGEASSNPSALENTPSIMSLLNSISKRQERRRTVSAKKEKDEQRRSSTPDPREQIPPYEPLTFPIPEDLFDSMLKMMPDEYPPPQEDCPQSTPATTTTTGNGLVDTNASLPPGVAQTNVCDQKLNNNKNAFLTLNNQKSTEHITGENEEEEDEDYEDYYLGEVNGDIIKEQMRSPPLATGIEFQPSFMCRNNLIGCSDTESLETENDGDDDPNDPEWKEEEKRK